MRLHKIAVALAALSIAGAATAAGNTSTTAGSTTNPSSNDQMTTRQTSPQSTQRSEASTNQAGSSQTGSPSSASQAGSASSEQNNPTVVREAQQALKQKGFDVGSVDGQMGPNTESALRNFQQAQGLPQTGNLDQQTLSKLGVNESGSSSSQSAMSGQGSQQSATSSQGSQSQGAMKHQGSAATSGSYK